MKINPQCHGIAMKCLNSFPFLKTERSKYEQKYKGYSKLIEYKPRYGLMGDSIIIDEYFTTVLNLFYKSRAQTRIFLTLRQDIRAPTWLKYTHGSTTKNPLKIRENNKAWTCAIDYDVFLCSKDKNCDLNLSRYPYNETIFTENIVGFEFKLKPPTVNILIRLSNTVRIDRGRSRGTQTTEHIVRIPLKSPTLLDLLSTVLHHTFHFDVKDHALIQELNRFRKQAGVPYALSMPRSSNRVIVYNGT